MIESPRSNHACASGPRKNNPAKTSALARCLLQLTAGSLVGQFGANAQRVAHWLVDKGWVHVVASDSHNLSGRRPRMTDAFAYVSRRWGEATARQLTLFAPAALCGVDLAAHGADSQASLQ